MLKAKATLICTVLNEEKTVGKLIDSIANQTVLPLEVIIVDGGSRDKTIEEIERKQKIYRKILNIKTIIKKGNRSVGRNEAIKNSTYEIILSTDSGNVLDKNWVKEIIKPFSKENADVVSGYYKGIGKTLFQKCLIPFVLVMRDKVNKADFLPATRSMAFKKSIWKKIGKFNENLSHNEDYDFANRLKKSNAVNKFTDKAIVNWYPRENIKQAFVMFFRFAFGDAESGIIRNKVIFLYIRYLVFFYLCFLSSVYKSLFLISFILLGIVFYLAWAALKNSKYIKDKRSFYVLPVLQIVSDIAVLSGTFFGYIKRIRYIPLRSIVLENKFFVLVLLVYIATTLSVIPWGIPNNNHPFLYHMDEWHQLQSVRFVFKYGSPNMEGAANGPIFHFFVSGILLIPFVLLKIVNPFAIKSAIDSIDVQHTLFIVLRLNTLLFGVLTLIFLNKISKLLKISSVLVVSSFAFTPVWLMLSNNFKYDIALTFWLTLAIYSFYKYFKNPTTYNFILACLLSALALSVKVTGAPLFLLVFVGFFLFTPNLIKNYKRLILGILSFLTTFILFGIPDLIFAGKNMNEYLNSNLNIVKAIGDTITTGYSTFSFLLLYHFPTIFGHTLSFVFLLALIYFLKIVLNNFSLENGKINRFYIFLLFYLGFFTISFYPIIHFGVGANRALPLLPAIVLIIAITVEELRIRMGKAEKKLFLFIIAILLFVQILESYAWVALKLTPAPQQASSEWILQNIKKGTIIGLENIPLYQKEPDVVLKEFYNKQYKTSLKLKYEYQIVDSHTGKLPPVVIVSDVKLSEEAEKISAKKDLIRRLQKEKYKITAQFSPAFTFYKYFGNTFNFIYSGLIAYPEDISIFEKDSNIKN